MNPTTKTKIYILSEPSGAVRYVGKTVGSLTKRLNKHKYEAAHNGKNNHRCNWLRSIGLQAEINLVEEVAGNGSKEEIEIIASLRNLGLKLVNATDGGEGLVGYVASPETRARLSAANTGKVPSAETRAKISATKKEQALSAETRAELSKRIMSPETRAKALKANVGRTCSAETKAKISTAEKGHVVLAETRAKISAARMGHAVSPETRKKISAAHNKITAQDVSRMREFRCAGWTYLCIAKSLGFSWNQVRRRLTNAN